MKLVLFGALLALLQSPLPALAENESNEYCFGKDLDRFQINQFATKTSYENARGANEISDPVPDCVATKIWIFHRHGTRLPDAEFIEKAPRLEELRDIIVKNYRELGNKPEHDALCQEDFLVLKTWKWNASITTDQAQYLTNQGYEDLRGTARFYQKHYPNLLPRLYNESDFLFRHTDTQRTLESFKAFTEGLFGRGVTVEAADIAERDLLLRPYDYCDLWSNINYKGEDSEFAKYRRSEQWNNTMSDISTRLGFLYTLNEADIELMFDVCRYEQAWHVERTSAWCAVFQPEHVTVLEYAEDLRYYYKAGYGNQLNSRINCRAVKDLLQRLDDNESPRAVVNFAHSTGLQTLLTALGIDEDEMPLRADNDDIMSERRWRTSDIDPFAANLAAIKYRCESDAHDKDKVLFFLNQHTVDLDWCRVGLCDLSEIRKRYAKYSAADCDELYCSVADSGASMGYSLLLLFAAAIFYLIY